MRKWFLLFYTFFNIFSSKGNTIDSLISVLDITLKDYKTFMDAKEERIRNIKKLVIGSFKAGDIKSEYNGNVLLYNEYRTYNIDSALYYLNKNLEISEKLKKKEWEIETKCYLSRVFSLSGMYNESMDMLKSIDSEEIPLSQKANYFSCNQLLYDELRKYSRFEKIAHQYNLIFNTLRDSLISYLDPASEQYLRVKEFILYENGNYKESRNLNLILLAKSSEGTPEYALTTYRIAMTYHSEGHKTLEKEYLILSAISDIKAAVKDNTSLALIASILYEEKDIDRAYRYIKFALEDANFFNARLRLVQVSNILPVINDTYQDKNEKQNAKLKLNLIVISVLTVILLLAALYIFRQLKYLAKAKGELQKANDQLSILNKDLHEANKKLENLNLELSETNVVKEQYIGLFLSICSAYIDKLDNYRRKVYKLISSGKTAELLETAKSKQIIEDELKEFYENFDNTFLHIYPNFVEELNLLLQEDERIILKKGELLNTELRIFALIRLGICDSSRIASLLRYSVNTIYNYRVKIKNKSAVPREDFENMVMRIGTFSK